MTTLALTALTIGLLIAFPLGLTTAKRHGDRQLARLLADLHTEADRQARIQAGFDAGWHGGGGRW